MIEKKENYLLNTKQCSFFLVICFVLLDIILIKSPLRLDDMAWGGHVGIDRLQEWFSGYNGRYVSNLLTIGLTRLPAVIRGTIETCILFTIVELLNWIIRDTRVKPIMLVLLATTPQAIITQTVTWTSGFTNYVVSLLFILYVVYLQMTEKDNYESCGWLVSLPIIVMGQLMLETTTLFVSAICFVFIVFNLIERKKTSMVRLTQFAASIIGLIIMFANSSYRSAVANDGETYKSIDIKGGILDLIKTWANKYANEIVPTWIGNNWLINLLLCLCLIVLITNSIVGNCKKKVLTIIMAVFASIILYNAIDSRWQYLEHLGMYFRAAFYSAFYIYIIAVTFILMDNKTDRFIVGGIGLSQIVLVAPLVFVSPVEARCFMQPFVFWILFLSLLISKVYERVIRSPILDKAYYHIISLVGSTMVIVLLSLYLNNQRHVWQVEKLREAAIYQCIKHDDNKLELPEVKWSYYYSYGGNISNDNDLWISRYKEYHGIPQKVELKFIGYDQYIESMEN